METGTNQCRDESVGGRHARDVVAVDFEHDGIPDRRREFALAAWRHDVIASRDDDGGRYVDFVHPGM